MLRRTFVLATALATLGLTACGSQEATPAGESAQKVSVTTTKGVVEVTKNPGKVVVMDYSVLDSMKALGLSDKVVGAPTSTLPSFLSDFKDVTNVGTMQEPDLEKLAELKPDAIIIGGRTAPKYDELTKVAPTLDLTFDGARFDESQKANATALGTLFDKQSEVDAKLAAIEEAEAETKAAAAKAGTGLVLLTSGGKISAFGPGSRFGLVHDVLGVTPAAKDLKADKHGQAVSNEFIATTNPDRLFVVDRDAAIGEKGSSAQEVLDNALVNKTNAARNQKITYLDGARWYLLGWGLDNSLQMIDEVKAGLA